MPDLFQHIETCAKVVSISLLVALLAWESRAPCYAFFSHHLKQRIIHGLVNFILTALNALLIGLVFSTLWLEASTWASENGIGLLNAIKLPLWLDTVAAILLFDVWTYWWHRINHAVPFLWRFHRVHHSDPEMDVTTANRFHFGEIAISSLLRVPVILAIGADLWQLALYEMIMFPIVQFHHANIRLPERWDRFIRMFVPTPAMHKVHHSDYYRETNSNYTSLLSIWDRVFGSFRLNTDLKSIRLGLKEFRSRQNQTLIALLKNPFKKRGEDVEKEQPPSAQ